MFKNLVKKAANKIESGIKNTVNEIKFQVAAIKNMRKALADSESMAMNEVQITNIILDEAAKCQVRIHGFEFKVGTYNDLKKDLPEMEKETRDHLLKKVGILRRINKVEELVNSAATAACQDVLGKIMGLTKFAEKYDNDIIYIFPEQIKSVWWMVATRGENIEEVTRQIVRHEFRHAEQIIAMRKVYSSEVVKWAFEKEQKYATYGQGPMEKDAWEGQHLDQYRPIEEFLKDEDAFLIK